MTSKAYPKFMRSTICIAMFMAVAALFVASFIALFPQDFTQNNPRQTIAGQKSEKEANPFDSLPLEDSQAITKLMEQLQQSPNDVDALLDIATIFINNENYVQGKSFLLRAIQNHPSHIDAHLMLGRCLYLQNDINGAAQTFENILTMEKSPVAMMNLGTIYKYHLNKKAEATSLFNQMLAMPDISENFTKKAQQELKEK